MPLPPEVDDAISPRSPLRPTRKSFAFALRTTALPPGRRIGTRECSKSLRYRCGCLCCYTLFQRLALLSDTSLVQSALRQRLLAPFYTASWRYTIIVFYPTLRCTRIIRLSAPADLSHRCSLATLTRSVRRQAFPAIGYGNTPCRSEHRNKRV